MPRLSFPPDIVVPLASSLRPPLITRPPRASALYHSFGRTIHPRTRSQRRAITTPRKGTIAHARRDERTERTRPAARSEREDDVRSRPALQVEFRRRRRRRPNPVPSITITLVTTSMTMAHLPGASSTPRRQPDRGQGQSEEGSPQNATNRHHRVDFRRGWMPSPEMPRLPLPDVGAALPGIGEAEDGREHEYEHEHGRRCEQHHGHAHHPLDLRRARPRSSRMHGGDENQTLNVNPNVNPNPNPNLHPAPRRSVSGSTGTSSTRTAHTTHNNTYAHAGRCQQCHCHCQCSSCKRPLRSTGTLWAAGHGAAAYAHTYIRSNFH